MKIDKAIEILTDQAGKGFHFPDQERKEASRLGAEALKEVKRLRSYKSFHVVKILTGETEE